MGLLLVMVPVVSVTSHTIYSQRLDQNSSPGPSNFLFLSMIYLNADYLPFRTLNLID